MKSTGNDLSRLPVWARNEILALRQQVEYQQKQLDGVFAVGTADKAQSHLRLMNGDPIPLPSWWRVRVQTGEGEEHYVDLSVDLDSKFVLARSGRGLWIVPQAANTALLKGGDFR